MNDSQMIAQLAHLHEKYRRSEQDLKMFLCNIAANPRWYPECVMWMIDIQGNVEGDMKVFEDPTVAEMATTDPKSFEAKMFEIGGSQMREVWQMLKDNNFKVTDKKLVDDNRWILGSQCVESSADLLCQMVYKLYADEISMGVISIRRMPWNMGIVGITNVAEARLWLRLHPKT